MGRVINTAGTGKKRGHLRRTIAELLRRLSQKQEIDEDAKNMVAMIALCLREIDGGIDDSVQAWEKRGYWIKSDEFRREWLWVRDMDADITNTIVEERWEEIPTILMRLIPRFADINVAKLTRSPELWANAHNKLIQDEEREGQGNQHNPNER